MSLTNAVLYPQYLVLVYFRADNGDIVDYDCFTVCATRADALSYMQLYKVRNPTPRFAVYDGRSVALSPAFRLYHLTRAKI